MHSWPLLTDSYKVTHWRQYPPGTEHVYSYFESRGGAFPDVVFFGLQYYLTRYLSKQVTRAEVDEAAEFWAAHFGDPTLFNRNGWLHIVNQHDGRLPLRICAVPEGTVVGTRNVLMTVENTDPVVPWLTNWVETLLSHVWYGSTVATQSREIKRRILQALVTTGTPELVDFKLHDFGYRGVSSVESAGIGGCAHLVNFRGTDTAAALEFARRYYGASMAGHSIPAAEHSTITSWEREGEVAAYRNMIEQFGSAGSGLYAVVSDSYDIYAACSDLWGGVLKDAVLAAPNTLVVRPDSGVPHKVVNQVIGALGAKFGFTANDRGFLVLNKVRVIQGDGVDYAEIDRILTEMTARGYSADNIAFGMGGALLQKLNRDTLKFAFKCSHAVVNGVGRDVYKQPVTDAGKDSKRGRLGLVRQNGGYVTVPEDQATDNELVVVYEESPKSKRTLTWSLAQVRERAAFPTLVTV